MIEYLLQDEKVESRELYEEVFPEDSKEFIDYYFQNKIEKHKVLVKRLQNNVVGMLHCNPHLLSIKGQQEEIDYIYAVATKKDYRNQGIMKELLVKALKDMHKEGKPFTYLIPVSEKIYSPYGFTYVSDNHKTTVKRNGLLKVASLNTVKLIDINDTNGDNNKRLNELAQFANRILEKKVDVFSYRNLSYYKDLLFQLKIANGQIELFYKDNVLQGYCHMNKDEQMSIQEILCQRDDMDLFIQAILEKYSLDEISVGGISGNSEGNQELNPSRIQFLMARILNLGSFFSYLTSKEELEVVIEITDPVIKENNGVFLWKCNESASFLQRSNEMPICKIGISDLTAWLFGYKEDISKNLLAVNTFSGVFINEEV